VFVDGLLPEQRLKMESQVVEYDSVADLRVPVSDDEDEEYCAAGEMIEDGVSAVGLTSTDTVQAGAAAGVTGTPARAPGHQVSGSATTSGSRKATSAVDPRLENVTSSGVTTLEPPGLLSAFSRCFLPSFLQQGRPQAAPTSMDVTGRPAERPTAVRPSRVASPTASGPRQCSASNARLRAADVGG